ncbi:DedA family protein [Aestuariimicrobium ganziense]|uniref:DedA family protein n=1 Tax=Aestuariimicrobium ganziense TaxID=2773677 RepID=UPI0019422798|nr:VTT domain-containing protein [Aestuariimicrobium ganziense]
MSISTFLAGLSGPVVYGTVAGLVGLESLGVPVPGETGLIAAALLATHPAAQVSLVGVFVAAWVGAVVGDSVGYAIGRRLGPELFVRLGRRFPRHFSPAHVACATHLFQRYGANRLRW